MVEVFKTNVWTDWDAEALVELLCRYFPGCKINFDLEDRDKILRVEGEDLLCDKIKVLVRENGFLCEALEG